MGPGLQARMVKQKPKGQAAKKNRAQAQMTVDTFKNQVVR